MAFASGPTALLYNGEQYIVGAKVASFVGGFLAGGEIAVKVMEESVDENYQHQVDFFARELYDSIKAKRKKKKRNMSGKKQIRQKNFRRK